MLLRTYKTEAIMPTIRQWANLRFFSVSLCVLGVFVVKMADEKSTTQAQRIHTEKMNSAHYPRSRMTSLGLA